MSFGLAYRVQTNLGYELHLVYNAFVVQSSLTHESMTNESSVSDFSWTVTTRPEQIEAVCTTAHLIIDSSIAYLETLTALEDLLYGSDVGDSYLPSPAEVRELFNEHSILRVTNHPDGTFTVEGPMDAIVMLDDTTFQITWPSVVQLDAVTYRISSL